MTIYVCPRCQRTFDRKSNYDQHLRRKYPCLIRTDKTKISSEKNNDEYLCVDCGHNFSSVSNLNKHQKSHCDARTKRLKTTDEQREKIVSVEKESDLDNVRREFMTLKNEFEQLKKNTITPTVNQNILQVLCVKSTDNYLDMLTDQWGDFHQALEFIKDCALSSLSGDCKLLNKIYFDSDLQERPIKYVDKSQHILEYVNEEREKIVDYKGQRLVKILANNLQNSYLKGINYLINKNLNGNMCPNKFLEEYDIQSWNAHIYELSDTRYQKKIFTQLEIPPNSSNVSK